MLGQIGSFMDAAQQKGLKLVPAKVTQTLSEDELIKLVPEYDGWIIGDDPATRRVFEAAKEGRLQAAVKWGIGIDNVDIAACRDLGIPIANTPKMFGGEVADVAVGYVIGLARRLFFIDRRIRMDQEWPKPAGVSLAGKKVGLVGYGDIGHALARRLLAFGMQIIAYDPVASGGEITGVERAVWPERLGEADFIVFTCSLNESNRHMLNAEILSVTKPGIYIVNVARGPLIDEQALANALETGHVAAAALDVFETEPLPTQSPLRCMPMCVFGSHNGSNTTEAVARASWQSIYKLSEFLIG